MQQGLDRAIQALGSYLKMDIKPSSKERCKNQSMLLTTHAMRCLELSAIKKLAMHQRYILGDKFICVHATGDDQLSLLWPNPTWRI